MCVLHLLGNQTHLHTRESCGALVLFILAVAWVAGVARAAGAAVSDNLL